MKVALIQCPLWGTFDPPIGLAQCSAYLKKDGHQVTLFDLNIKLYLNQKEDRQDIWSWEMGDFWYHPEYVNKFFLDNSGIINHYIKEILNKDIEIAGFSVNTASRLFSLEFARRLKTENKNIIVVFGGPIFLKESFVNDILEEECIDIVIPGEGLSSFSGLIDAFKSGKKIDSCKGLIFRRNNAIINTGPASLVDLNNLPFLDLSDLSLKDYDNGTHISLMASRGCVRHCVFCSDAPCWQGYKAMSGRRIFEEIKFHKDKYEDLSYIDFMDLAFNANMASLIEFCDLMIEANLDLIWTANMYIRPEMTPEVIKKMKAAKCEHIIIGIESGSEKILKSMNKYYSMADADRIIKQMYDVGICVTANFMFGFPGETEEDFNLTLDFLRRNGRYMGVYPSRTYCALEEFSYLEKHLEEFGIKPNPPDYLFWESVDGTNTYPVRLDRCRRFCELALKLGVGITAGVQTTVELDEYFNLGCYYEFKGDYPNAVTNFLNYFHGNPMNTIIRDKLLAFQKILPRLGLDKNTKDNFEKAIDIINDGKCLSKKIRVDRSFSSALVKLKIEKLNDEIKLFEIEKDSYSNIALLINNINKTKISYKRLSEQLQYNLSSQFNQLMQRVSAIPLRQLNQRLNEGEFKAKKAYLNTFPVVVHLPVLTDGDDFCYIFKPPKEKRDRFSLEKLKEYAEDKIDFLLLCARRCILKGGENLSLNRENETIFDYLEQIFPGLEKEFFSNGINFSKEMINKLCNYPSSFIINFALHASHRNLHRKIGNKDNFNEIRANLEYLSKSRRKTKNIVLNLTYTATLINIEDLPNVIRLAAKFNIDKVIVDYNRIYTAEQKDISCFFKQDLTNKMIDMAEREAECLNLVVQLPPKFNQDFYHELTICKNPWNQLVLNSDGKFFPCEHFRIWDIRFDNKGSLGQIWNSREYKAIRSCFRMLSCSECSRFCYYVNPRQVNSLRSHIFNAKYFGFEDKQKLKEDLILDLDESDMEKIIDLAECCLFSSQDLVSSERIIKYILEKGKYPSRPFRLLAGIYREKAELADSMFEKEHLLMLAREAVEKSLACGPSDPWTFAEAARIYSFLGHYKEANAAIKKFLSLSPQEEKFKLLEQKIIKELDEKKSDV